MTEKPFTLECEDEEICQIVYKGNYMGTDEVVDLLNEQDEVIDLCEKRIQELRKENKDWRKLHEDMNKTYSQLVEENHRLRLTLCHSSDLNFDIEWLKEHLGEWKNE